MIANFARMHRDASPRALVEAEPPADAPPEQFVQKVNDEAGDVFLSPILEALREALRARRGRPASHDEPETTTNPSPTEGA